MNRATRAAALLLVAVWALAACAARTVETPAAEDTTRSIAASPGPDLSAAPPAASPAASPAPTRAATTPATGSGIAGLTLIDNCPVQRAGTPCPGADVAARLSIVNAGSGAVVASVTSHPDGHFSVAVEPGRYLIRIVSVGALPPHSQNPASVTVTAGHYTPVTLRIDVGIR